MAELDPNQQAAVDAGPVDLFIEAGAGSGKTRVLTHRFVSAVLGEGPYTSSDPRALPTVTFTDKAAGELAERIRRTLNARGEEGMARGLGDAWISTIHGMCARILRTHAFAAGIDPYFAVLDQVESSALEAEALEQALGEAVAGDDAAAAMIDAYGYESLAGALTAVRASVRALGSSAEDVRRVDPASALARLRQAAEELDDLACGMEALRQTRTVTCNAGVARQAGRCVRNALACDTPDPWGLLSGLSGVGLRKVATIDGHDDMLEALKVTLGTARAAAAQLAVAEHEVAFLSVLRAFEERYEAAKRTRGALDFNDLEVHAARLLESDPEVARTYRARFAMVMIDEFQDTNRLQARIVGLISHDNLCTVGDESQSIYRFRHADVDVFRERGARAAVRQRLDINYRTAPALLDVTNRLFSHPALLGRSFGMLKPSPDCLDAPTRFAGEPRFELRMVDWSSPQGRDSHEAEAASVAARVAELLASGVEPGRIAVLMRALARGRGTAVERALSARGIPAHLASGGAFYACREVTETRALLKVIENVFDDQAVATVLAGSLCAVSADGLARLRERAEEIARGEGRARRNAHLWDAMSAPDRSLTGADRAAAARLVDAVVAARASRGIATVGEVLRRTLLALDVDLVCFASGRGGARAWSNLLKLVRLAEEYESATGGGVGGLLRYLELHELYARGEQEATLDGESEAVRVMSIHAAKGLEFDVVLLAGLDGAGSSPGVTIERVDCQPLLGMYLPTADGAQPTLASESVLATREAAAEAEALRLLYVGCTRARESLTVVVRTDPEREATDSLSGRLRRALGIGAGGVPEHGSVSALDGLATLTLEGPRTAHAAAEEGDGGSPVGAEMRSTTDVLGASPGRAGPVATGPLPATASTAPVPPARVSYSGLATFERCPYRFFLGSVLHLPAPPAAQGGDALAFGSAVHHVLERLLASDDEPSPLIEEAVRTAGLGRASVRRLEAAVDAYRTSPVAAEVFAAENVLREAPLIVALGDTVLDGAIDAIAWLDDAALVVDYKTGTAPLSAADARERYRLQGACYALAALAAGARVVRIVFMELERGRETAFRYSADDRDDLLAQVRGILDRMAREGYPSRGVYDRELCETCPGLGGMCPVTRPRSGGAE